MINIFELMQSSKEITKKLEEMRAQKVKQIHSATVGSDEVTVTINGNFECLDVKIAEHLLNPNEAQKLRDLLRAAFNEAAKKANSSGANDMLGELKNMMASGNFNQFFK